MPHVEMANSNQALSATPSALGKNLVVMENTLVFIPAPLNSTFCTTGTADLILHLYPISSLRAASPPSGRHYTWLSIPLRQGLLAAKVSPR